MKTLVIIAIALATTFQVTAQEDRRQKRKHLKKERTERIQQFKPEDIAQIQTKKMTLHLDLTEAQQKKIMALNLEKAKKRKAKIEARSKKKKEKPTQEERLKMINEKLDAQIETKKQMKKILTAEQLEKWEKAMHRKSRKFREKSKKRKTKQRQRESLEPKNKD